MSSETVVSFEAVEKHVAEVQKQKRRELEAKEKRVWGPAVAVASSGLTVGLVSASNFVMLIAGLATVLACERFVLWVAVACGAIALACWLLAVYIAAVYKLYGCCYREDSRCVLCCCVFFPLMSIGVLLLDLFI